MKKQKLDLENIAGVLLFALTLSAVWIPEFIKPTLTAWTLWVAYLCVR